MREKRILLVATTTGYQTRVFAEAARRLGVDVLLATDRCPRLDDPWGDQAVVVRFEAAKRSAQRLASLGPVGGVVALGDRPAYLAALAAEKLGVPFNPPEAVAAAGDKYRARQRFRAAGMPVPLYRRVRLDGDPVAAAQRCAYPCVLKPLGLSGSRGVIRADDEAEFVRAFERIRSILGSPDLDRRGDETARFLQVEDFIPGKEFALEGLVSGGGLQMLAIFDKPDPLDGPYFEETIYVTPSREPAAVQRELCQAAQAAVTALGLTDGPVHAEMRYNDRGAWMLEAAPRPIGGLCARALRFGAGMPLEELILRHALGEDTRAIRREDDAAGVMMIPIPVAGTYQGVRGLEAAKAVPGVEDIVITAKQGQHVLPLPEGSSYLGFIFARCCTPQEVEDSLRRAHARLEFEFARNLPVLA